MNMNTRPLVNWTPHERNEAYSDFWAIAKAHRNLSASRQCANISDVDIEYIDLLYEPPGGLRFYELNQYFLQHFGCLLGGRQKLLDELQY